MLQMCYTHDILSQEVMKVSEPSSSRIMTSVEDSLYETLEHMADRDDVSLSRKVRDLLRKAIELDEDADLISLVEERKEGPTEFVDHEDFWSNVDAE